jgi:hypothetical protein
LGLVLLARKQSEPEGFPSFPSIFNDMIIAYSIKIVNKIMPILSKISKKNYQKTAKTAAVW